MSTESQLQLTTNDLTINVDKLDSETIQSKLQGRLRYYYSRRLFVQNVVHDPEEDYLSVTVGITYPQDVSGSRNGNNVLKMVNIGDVYTLNATATGSGYYSFDLPARTDLYQSYQKRHEELLNELDWSMAKAIYSRVYQLNPVRNQLNSVIQIVNWVRRQDDVTIDQIEKEQTTDNSRKYIEVLEELGFLRTEGGLVRPGQKIESADLQNLSRDQYEERVIGDLVTDGYYVLKKELGLGMLSHFPIFANAYYLSAFRREKPDLWLTVDDIIDNLRTEYGRDEGRLTVEDKLRDLSRVDVLQYENNEVSGHEDIYKAVQQDHPLVG